MPDRDDILDFLKSLVDFLKFLFFPLISILIIALLITFNVIDKEIGILLGFFIITALVILYYIKLICYTIENPNKYNIYWFFKN